MTRETNVAIDDCPIGDDCVDCDPFEGMHYAQPVRFTPVEATAHHTWERNALYAALVVNSDTQGVPGTGPALQLTVDTGHGSGPRERYVRIAANDCDPGRALPRNRTGCEHRAGIFCNALAGTNSWSEGASVSGPVRRVMVSPRGIVHHPSCVKVPAATEQGQWGYSLNVQRVLGDVRAGRPVASTMQGPAYGPIARRLCRCVAQMPE